MQEDQNLTDGMQIMVEALLKNNVTAIYGVVGIPITDLARQAQKNGIRYIGFRHEQSAGYAAAISGYLTQKPGILLTVSAPGFLNGLSALANATINGFPMIQISGSSTRSIIDLQQGDYEGLDQMNIAKPFCKASYRIDKPEDIATGLARAIRAAVSGRPGGVYLDLTTALLESTMDKAEAEKTLFTPINSAPKLAPEQEDIDRALELLRSAKQPLLIIGKGAAYAQAENEVKTFVEQTGIPFLPMSMAKGLLPDNHPQSAAAARSFVLKNADVVVLMGARLNWLLTYGKGKHWNPEAKFVQFDIEANEFDSNQPIAAPVAGDLRKALDLVNTVLTKEPIKVSDAWRNAIDETQKPNIEKMAAKLAANPSPMNYYSALNAIKKILDNHRDIYLVNEGANTLDNARDIIDMIYPRRRLDCGTWGVMGVGMGFAIGAAVTSGKPVVAIEGDSAFGFSGMEISTICRYKLPVVIIIFNNGGIYRGDDPNLSGGSDPSPTTLDAAARYDKLITAFDGDAYHVETPNELSASLETALTTKRPAIINCVIDPAAGTESGHIGNLNPQTLHLAEKDK